MPPATTNIDLFALAPELTLCATSLLVLLVELFLPGPRKRLVNPLAVAGVLVAAGWLIALAVDVTGGGTRAAFGNMFVVDRYALLFKGFFVFVALFVLLLSYRYFSEFRTWQGEYYFLLLAAFLGGMLMASARDLVMIFIALELVSVPGFVMAGLRKYDLRSNEGALKFFLIGVLSVAVLLFGLSLIYGYTGTTDLVGVATALRGLEPTPLLYAAMLFVIVGFGFKVSAVPFHFWAPDTYEGAPVPVTAFLSVASKAAGFAGLLQVCFVAFEPYAEVWSPVLGVLAIATMTLGNLTALQQTNVVRLFAYSSVAHAGYMLVPFGLVRAGALDVNQQAFASVMIYLLAYAVMNVGAFACVVAYTRSEPSRTIASYAGMGHRAPGLALGLTMFLLSLGGIPVFVGFWAKVFIFFASVEAGTPFTYVLAASVVINSVIAMFYYLNLIRLMWMGTPETSEPVRPGMALNTAVVALSAVAVAVFFVPDVFAEAARVSTLVVGSG